MRTASSTVSRTVSASPMAPSRPDIGDSTTATFSVSHQVRDITPFNGLPTFQDGTLIDLPRSTFTGADWNRFDNSVTRLYR